MGGYPQTFLDHGQARAARDRLRNEAERVLELAAHLPQEDRALLRAVYDRGMKFSELGAACSQSPQRLRRRARRLMSRLRSPLFRFVLSHARRWDERDRHVGRLVVVEGCSIREAARRLNCSMHRIRLALTRIHALHEAQGESPTAPRVRADEISGVVDA